jgi:hypothetical protein
MQAAEMCVGEYLRGRTAAGSQAGASYTSRSAEISAPVSRRLPPGPPPPGVSSI